jgi:2-amino-4-hydroxy-6-hydroxymethyldihydropteridine diphosphokinase
MDNQSKPETIFLSLGSNVGDREKNLRAAIGFLPEAGVDVTRVSSFYETEPVDLLEQPWFLNCVVQGQTVVPAVELLRKLREVESRMGSRKVIARGPRLIDLDILLYGQQIVDTAELQVPHPRMHLRRFVLEPLVEIAPHAKHPFWRGTAADLLRELADGSVVKKIPSS